MNNKPKRYKNSHYLVYDDGRVYSEKSGKFLSAGKQGRYFNYNLCICGERTTITRHRIVAICFIPNPDNLPMVRHLDDNTQNDSVENLAWGTDWDNKQDAKKNGRYNTGNYNKPGEKHSQSRLNNEQVYKIREMYASGEKTNVIGKMFGISTNHAYGIVKRIAWKHL